MVIDADVIFTARLAAADDAAPRRPEVGAVTGYIKEGTAQRTT